MSTTSLFLTAAGVGLAIAAPVGPMGMLCIRRTLTGGPRAGLAIGFGIATGDAAYGLIAALGLVGISQFMLAYDRPLHLLAGLFLLYLGVRTLLQKAPADARTIRVKARTAAASSRKWAAPARCAPTRVPCCSR